MQKYRVFIQDMTFVVAGTQNEEVAEISIDEVKLEWRERGDSVAAIGAEIIIADANGPFISSHAYQLDIVASSAMKQKLVHIEELVGEERLGKELIIAVAKEFAQSHTHAPALRAGYSVIKL